MSAGNLTDETFASVLKVMGHRIPRQPYYPVVPKVELDPSTIDWDKPNNMLAAELNVAAIRISKLRKLHGRPKLFNYQTAHIKWNELDWTKNNQQLSRELGIGISGIVKHRIRLGHPQPPAESSNKAVTSEMIEATDWAMVHDTHLARDWGISRERVRQIRQQNQKPKCQLNSCDSLTMELEKWLIENKDSIAGMLASEVADMCPVVLNKTQKFYVMKKSEIPFIFKRQRQHSSLDLPINWELPNAFLEAIWNRCRNWASSTRNRFSISKSPHKHHGNINKGRANMFDMEMLSPMISAEIEKATKLGIKPDLERLKEYSYLTPVEQEQTV